MSEHDPDPSIDPATPQWTWTVNASADALRAVAAESDTPGDHALTRVLDALAPHVARHVADLTAEVERLRIALATVNTSFDAVSAREAIRSELITQGLAAAEQVDELRRLVAGLEAENDNYHADLIRVIGERDAALAKVEAVKALVEHYRSAADAMDPGFSAMSFSLNETTHAMQRTIADHYAAYGVRTVVFEIRDVLAADSQRPVLPPGDAQEPRTPVPGSPGTPETLSVPLSGLRDPHGA